MRHLPVACVFGAVLAFVGTTLGGDPDGATNLAGKTGLPAGDGLAAQFPNDAGLKSRAEVIFADDFETGSIGAGWDETRNKDGKVLQFAAPGDGAGLGQRCLRVEAHLGKDTGGGLTKWFEPSDLVFIRFYARFDPGCDYVHHFVTLRANKSLRGADKWSGFGGAGLKPEGAERFSTAIEPWGNWGRWPAPGRWNFYSYWHEMEASKDGKYWGNSFGVPAAPVIPRGRWVCVEFMLKHNTPGQPDGEQAFWIDGALQGHWKGINWRKTATLKANALTLESYITDRWTTNPVNVVCFDNVVVARRYIGPVGRKQNAVEQNPASTVTVRPEDNAKALVNPDMGWTLHFYSNIPENYGSKLAPSDTLEDFPGLSTVYLRVPWAFLEPEEGQFNWALLDTPAQRWVARGKRIAVRVTCSENWLALATPEWVRKAGAKGYNYEFGKGRSEKGWTWDPDFGDPVFLQKLDNFLKALAARYDGNRNVAFLDIGSYGLWGEGHTFMSSQVPEAEARALVKKHIDLHVTHFKKTLLCISDDVAGHDKPGRHFPETDYALSKGVTLRDDSILVQPPPRSWYHAELAQEFWPGWPVILEHEHYGGSKARGAWRDGSLLLKAVEDYHASYLSIHWWPREFLAENRSLIERINRRLGYRLQLRELSWPQEVIIGQPFQVRSLWANAGVAPCYPGGFMAVTLKDAKDGIAAVLVDESFNLRDLKPGPSDRVPVTERTARFVAGLVAPVTLPGDYALYVSVGSRDGTPRLALPLAGEDGQLRYRLGRVSLRRKDG